MKRIASEDLLIQRIARAVPARPSAVANFGLALGIGDDAAILASRKSTDWVVSCDAFIEGVHFLADVHPADSVGYKALVRAASDLVAMGAAPRLFLLSLSLPAKRAGAWLDDFLAGLARAARYLGMLLAGGDTTSGDSIGLSITVLGQVAQKGGGRAGSRRHGPYHGQALTRFGARAGDRIYVSGTLGRAQLGLELVRKGYVKRRNLAPILQPHLYPRLRLELGPWLARNRIPSAMMDLSDGLSSDLARLCRASGVGAKVWADRIPVVSDSALLKPMKLLRSEALLITRNQMALHGGDDYELLFTVPKWNEHRLRTAPDFAALTPIGEITRHRNVLLVDARGNAQPLTAGGWDPFR
jgi:thiamine-monophosphate kinase